MNKVIIFVMGISVICGCTHLQDQSAEQKSNAPIDLSESYYDTLKSLLGTYTFNIRPKPTERDVNLIEPEKGGMGVLFGATMEEVFAVWGKPAGIWIRGGEDLWEFEIGACDFAFIDNSLVGIEIHEASMENAYFENGINFTSSVEEVKAAFGEPSEETKYGLEYYTKNGYFIDFQFTSSDDKNGDPALINISIYHPDAGK